MFNPESYPDSGSTQNPLSKKLSIFFRRLAGDCSINRKPDEQLFEEQFILAKNVLDKLQSDQEFSVDNPLGNLVLGVQRGLLEIIDHPHSCITLEQNYEENKKNFPLVMLLEDTIGLDGRIGNDYIDRRKINLTMPVQEVSVVTTKNTYNFQLKAIDFSLKINVSADRQHAKLDYLTLHLQLGLIENQQSKLADRQQLNHIARIDISNLGTLDHFSFIQILNSDAKPYFIKDISNLMIVLENVLRLIQEANNIKDNLTAQCRLDELTVDQLIGN